ncbi:MAG: hypothetical protein ABMA00_17155, partial [Gemmatimonas sp.]
ADSARRDGAYVLDNIDGRSLGVDSTRTSSQDQVLSAMLTIRGDRFVLDYTMRLAEQLNRSTRQVEGEARTEGAFMRMFPNASGGYYYYGSPAVMASDGRFQVEPDGEGFWPLVGVVNNFRRIP